MSFDIVWHVYNETTAADCVAEHEVTTGWFHELTTWKQIFSSYVPGDALHSEQLGRGDRSPLIMISS
jgi:hypothetical protein